MIRVDNRVYIAHGHCTGFVGRHVAGVVGIRNTAGGHVAELIGTVRMPEIEHGGAGYVADPAWCCRVHGCVIDVIPKMSHQRIEDRRLASGKQVNRRPVSGEADGFVLIGTSAFVPGSA